MAEARGATRIGAARNMPEKPPKGHMRSEKVSNTIDLTPKLHKLPRPCAPERGRRNCANSGVEPKHDRESLSEACAREEVPNTVDLHAKMQKNQSAKHISATAIHKTDVDG
jgi:hypothetical protein